MVVQASCGFAFTRTVSVAKAQAEDVRMQIHDVFESVDSNGSGTVDLKELSMICSKQLHMQFKDPIHDVETIFAMVDKDNTGTIEVGEFMDLVEPVVLDFERRGFHMDCDEIIREAFSAVIQQAKDERTIVNKAFLWAHEQMTTQGKGFGTYFWGFSWRFRMYDDFYDNAVEHGKPVPPPARLNHLKSNLAAMVAGANTWFEQKRQVDDLVGKEVSNVQGLVEYCELWLRRIRQLEEEELAAAYQDSSDTEDDSPESASRAEHAGDRRRLSLCLDIRRTLRRASMCDEDLVEAELEETNCSAASTVEGGDFGKVNSDSDWGDENVGFVRG